MPSKSGFEERLFAVLLAIFLIGIALATAQELSAWQAGGDPPPIVVRHQKAPTDKHHKGARQPSPPPPPPPPP